MLKKIFIAFSAVLCSVSLGLCYASLQSFRTSNAIIISNVDALTNGEWNPDIPESEESWFVSRTEEAIFCTPGGQEACE